MMEDGVQPGETVTSPMLKFVFFGVPLVFIVLRQISIRCGVFRSPRSFADLLLGLLFCQMMCLLLTDTIKAYVARPRPNCFALQALVEYGGSDVYPFQETSIKSFPSGHSSESMAGSSFITLVCWADLLHCSACFTGWKRSLLAYLAVLPALISIWVGVTRIRDYWHFQDDVLTGWTIGAISAAVAVRWVIYPETYWRRSTMENKNLEEHMEINMLPNGQNNAFTLIDPTYGSAGYSPHDQKQNPIASV